MVDVTNWVKSYASLSSSAPCLTVLRSILRAIRRSRNAILSVAVVYALTVAVGAAMVHTGNQFALDYRDNLVDKARESDQVLRAYNSGHPVTAALLDFAMNLFLGAVSSTLSGLAIVTAYPFIVYRGWVGGIVSVNDMHVSRLATPYGAFYYLTTITLQLIPYTLAGGAGVNLGIAYLRPPIHYRGGKFLGVPREAILDTLRIYILVVPLLLCASLFEFLA